MIRPVLTLAFAMWLTGCAPATEPAPMGKDHSACASAKPALDVMQSFVAAFNAKDMAALEKTFHFPHMRIAAYPLHILTGPGQQDDVFGNLAAEGWATSRWDDIAIVQCGPEKAHIVATFARLRADGTEYASYEGLYIVEYRDGFWGITARSTFAP
jgi:hypothetical protein